MKVILKRLDNGRIRIIDLADLATANTDHSDFWGATETTKLTTAGSQFAGNGDVGERFTDADMKMTIRRY